VATDIAARGIDVDRLEYVINYDLPNIPESYVHRIGRTGRAGSDGTAFAFCDSEEKAYLKDIEKLIKRKIAVIDDHPFPLGSVEPAAPAEGSSTPAGQNRGSGSRPPRSAKYKGASSRRRSTR
jgi:ATP-dependent RNA helicase RhlE